MQPRASSTRMRSKRREQPDLTSLREPIRLVPQDKLVEIVRRSQALALEGEGGEADQAS